MYTNVLGHHQVDIENIENIKELFAMARLIAHMVLMNLAVLKDVQVKGLENVVDFPQNV